MFQHGVINATVNYGKRHHDKILKYGAEKERRAWPRVLKCTEQGLQRMTIGASSKVRRG